MIDLKSIIARINDLLAENSSQSVTYAALEARLAIEKVCYDRLRQRHDYISHAQLQKWQPGAVVKTLMTDVDPYVSQTVILHIGTKPGSNPENDEYVEIGTEVGFNTRKLSEMWNALAKLALHVHLPRNREEYIPEYGDKENIIDKVKEVVSELERLSKGNITSSGFGGSTSFTCSCGEENHRRTGLLRDGQIIRCINHECKETWKVIKSNDGISFQSVTVTVNCEICNSPCNIPWQMVCDMKYDQVGSFSCGSCGHKNYVQWRLKQVRPTTD